MDHINYSLLKSKKVVITFGVFDLLHLGHINLVRALSNYGDYIVIFVHSDDSVLESKGKLPFYDENTRLLMINSIKGVNAVFLYKNVYDMITSHNIINYVDVFVHGPDQTHIHFQRSIEFLQKKNISVVTLPRTDGISTTFFNEGLKEKTSL